jgi:hypothetical protein
MYDIRCKDVARILAEGPKAYKEIATELHTIYSRLDPQGSWIKTVLLKWNPLVVNIGKNMWDLSDLGKAFVKLPGNFGGPLTDAEKYFITGLLMSDKEQREIASELILHGKSSYKNRWVVNATRVMLKRLGII